MEIDKKIIKKLIDVLEDLKKSLNKNGEQIDISEIKSNDDSSEIENYNNKKVSESTINEISNITSMILQCSSMESFEKLIESHELIISKLISKLTIKETLFKDFNGSIKSLGAWGGDVIMVTSHSDPSQYFIEKGYSTIFKFDELLV